MELQGTLIRIDDTQSFGTNGFRKREVVLKTEEQFPQPIMIEFTQDKCDLLNSYKVGDNAKISINIRGREWTNPQGETKYFNSIQGWRIEKVESIREASDRVENMAFEGDAPDDEGNDLPF